MLFRILGPVEVHNDGARIAINGAKPQTVLAALLLSEGKVVTDSTLTALLWGDGPPATAGSQLYTYASRLRKQLAPYVDIQRRRSGYALHLGRAKLDYAEFCSLSQQGRDQLERGDVKSAADTFVQALSLWRGGALATTTEFMIMLEEPALREAHIAALEGRLAADLALGRHAQIVPELVRLVAQNPLREQLRIQLMSALYHCDRRAEAIEAYHRGRSILADEVGIDVGPTMRGVFQSILEDTLENQLDTHDARAAFAR